DAALARVQHARLLEVGWMRGDSVVLAAVGSKDPRALADVATAAALLSAQLDTPVRHGFAVAAEPTIVQVVAQLRADGVRRVIISPYLLAPGQFHVALADVGADAVAAALGVHPLLVDLVGRRYREVGGAVAAGA
ncbi:MAG: CbiX/SirB N-terminal domain-containing protein, partial [Mycobacteriaceae bacterium]